MGSAGEAACRCPTILKDGNTYFLVALFEYFAAVEHVVDCGQVGQDGRGGSPESGDAVKLTVGKLKA